jgi:glycosyltransferase involved in cell wall biosynthesis
MRTNLLFLLPNPRKAATSLEELILRHQIYVRKFIEMQTTTSEIPWVIIGDNLVEPLNLNAPELQVKFIGKSKMCFFPFIFNAVRIMKRSHFKPDVIVAGDTYFTALSAFIIRRIYVRDAQIQLSLHGEVGALTIGGIKPRIKYFLTKISVKHADIFRFVSRQQMDGFICEFNFGDKKLLVTPVPTSTRLAQSSVPVKRAIAFVGRIQQERGVSEWIEIVKLFHQEELMIIGDGPLATSMKSVLSRATFTGLLTNQEVQKKWIDIGVLLSTAPYESYGLAMREALLHGVPVVSKESAGAIELEQRYPNLIKLYRTKDQAQQYLKGFLEKPLDKKEFEAFRKNFFAEQEESLIRLAKVWLNEV